MIGVWDISDELTWGFSKSILDKYCDFSSRFSGIFYFELYEDKCSSYFLSSFGSLVLLSFPSLGIFYYSESWDTIQSTWFSCFRVVNNFGRSGTFTETVTLLSLFLLFEIFYPLGLSLTDSAFNSPTSYLDFT